MNPNWDKQCALDRKLLADIHTAVCGNVDMGVPGLVNTVKSHSTRLESLEASKNGGVAVSKFGSVVLGILVSLSFIGCFSVAIYEACKK